MPPPVPLSVWPQAGLPVRDCCRPHARCLEGAPAGESWAWRARHGGSGGGDGDGGKLGRGGGDGQGWFAGATRVNSGEDEPALLRYLLHVCRLVLGQLRRNVRLYISRVVVLSLARPLLALREQANEALVLTFTLCIIVVDRIGCVSIFLCRGLSICSLRVLDSSGVVVGILGAIANCFLRSCSISATAKKIYRCG
jgi:hypothetical protein